MYPPVNTPLISLLHPVPNPHPFPPLSYPTLSILPYPFNLILLFSPLIFYPHPHLTSPSTFPFAQVRPLPPPCVDLTRTDSARCTVRYQRCPYVPRTFPCLHRFVDPNSKYFFLLGFPLSFSTQCISRITHMHLTRCHYAMQSVTVRQIL